MAVTRLKRKAKRNRLRARQKQDRVQHLLRRPVIRMQKTVEESPVTPNPTSTETQAG